MPKPKITPSSTPSLPFMTGLDSDLKQHLVNGLKELWTHHSTALEGNTLTLQETHFVLSEGLTISGKSLADHNEVVGHARAIDLLFEMVKPSHGPITHSDIFLLHKSVQTESIFDIMSPVGGWKVEPNGRYAYNKDNRMTFHSYAHPDYIPKLMDEWCEALNDDALNTKADLPKLIDNYAFLHAGFTSVHPFFDGNGRMGRLLCNIPLLKAGFPPLVIRNESRTDYLKALQEYSEATPVPDKFTGVWPAGDAYLDKLKACCHHEYTETLELMNQIQCEQQKRDHWREENKTKGVLDDPSF